MRERMVRRGWVECQVSRWGRGAGRALGVVVLTACSEPAPPTRTSRDDWAARIGAATLPADVMAVGLGADPDGARAVRNFGLANALERVEPDGSAWLRRAALAHVVADELTAAAQADGPPTDEELAAWTSANWLGVDRPAAFRAIHAVVVSDAKAGPAEPDAAFALAERIRLAVLGAASAEEFRAKASEVPTATLTVKVEDLEPVAPDGRVVRLGAKVGAAIATYDEAFARAASSLSRIGETSPVVTSSFGYHVLRLVEVVPELRFGIDERRVMAERDVFDLRARKQLKELIATARQPEFVGVERSAEEATARVSVE